MKKSLLAVVAATSIFTMAACSNESDKPVVTTSAGDITEQQLYDSMKDYLGESMLYQMVVDKVLSKDFKVTDKEIKEELDKLKTAYGTQFDLMLQSAGKTEEQLKEEIRFIKLREKAAKSTVKITDKEIKEAYDAKKPEIKASHILVKTEDEAKDIKKQLDKGADFAKLAEKYSTDTGSAAKGGDLGYFGVGMMVEPFETAAYKLKLNEISDPVQSEHGYHIIKLTGKKEKESFDKLKDSIKEELIEEKLTANFISEAVTKILDKADIKVKDKDLKNTFTNAKEALEKAKAEEEAKTQE